MAHTLSIIQITSAMLLVALVLMQRTQGDMGNTSSDGSFMQTRRGAEKFIFFTTIIVALIFVGTSIGIIIALHK